MCAFTDEGKTMEEGDGGINSVVRISLRDILSPFFSFAEAIISRALTPLQMFRPVPRDSCGLFAAVKEKGPARLCPTFFTGR